MARWIQAVAMVLAIGCGEGTKGTASSVEQHADAPPGTRNDFPDPPPNTPPPPATCGDQNGGGDQHIDFEGMRAAKVAEKPAVEERQAELLAARYDLSDRPAPDVMMTRGKPVQQGVRVLLPGLSWSELAAMSPEEIKARDLFPFGFFPLPHPKQAEGGMLFPHFTIDELARQTGRDLTRFDLDFDLPDLFLPEFPPAIFLTTQPNLGDVSRGQLVTLMNFMALFDGL